MSCVVFDGSKTADDDDVKSISPTLRRGRMSHSFGNLKIKSGSLVEPSDISTKVGSNTRSKQPSLSEYSSTGAGSISRIATKSITYANNKPNKPETYKDFKNGIRVLKSNNNTAVPSEIQNSFHEEQTQENTNGKFEKNTAEVLRLQQKMAKLQNKVASMQEKVLFLQEKV